MLLYRASLNDSRYTLIHFSAFTLFHLKYRLLKFTDHFSCLVSYKNTSSAVDYCHQNSKKKPNTSFIIYKTWPQALILHPSLTIKDVSRHDSHLQKHCLPTQFSNLNLKNLYLKSTRVCYQREVHG